MLSKTHLPPTSSQQLTYIQRALNDLPIFNALRVMGICDNSGSPEWEEARRSELLVMCRDIQNEDGTTKPDSENAANIVVDDDLVCEEKRKKATRGMPRIVPREGDSSSDNFDDATHIVVDNHLAGPTLRVIKDSPPVSASPVELQKIVYHYGRVEKGGEVKPQTRYIVCMAWLTECVRQGKRVPEEPYSILGSVPIPRLSCSRPPLPQAVPSRTPHTPLAASTSSSSGTGRVQLPAWAGRPQPPAWAGRPQPPAWAGRSDHPRSPTPRTGGNPYGPLPGSSTPGTDPRPYSPSSPSPPPSAKSLGKRRASPDHDNDEEEYLPRGPPSAPAPRAPIPPSWARSTSKRRKDPEDDGAPAQWSGHHR